MHLCTHRVANLPQHRRLTLAGNPERLTQEPLAALVQQAPEVVLVKDWEHGVHRPLGRQGRRKEEDIPRRGFKGDHDKGTIQYSVQDWILSSLRQECLTVGGPGTSIVLCLMVLYLQDIVLSQVTAHAGLCEHVDAR